MLDYAAALNEAQYAAATCGPGPTLVIAGAGSGKTRTIVYRLAWLVEHDVAPEEILLLTFTRKAAREMLGRAASLLGMGMGGVNGGTFHSFAYGALKAFPPDWLEGRQFTLLDSPDSLQALRQCREKLKIGRGDSSFPKNQTIASLLSKARNKEMPLAELLRRDSFHLLPHAQAVEDIGAAYARYRRENALFDYDDLLFELDAMLAANGPAARRLRQRHSHLLVDEYQDTNLVQARIVRHLALAPEDPARPANVMAVGDEAQSIYAFRGANVRNILDFPKIFPEARTIPLEENYRSDQPILDLANNILEAAPESFRKHLFTRRKGGEPVRLVRPLSDSSEAQMVVARIRELLREFMPHEIAVLFRAGYHSYPLEAALRQEGIPFRKYGGMRMVEAAHVKDTLAFARLAINILDLPAFERLAAMHRGVGPKTAARLHAILAKNDPDATAKAFGRYPELRNDLEFIARMRGLGAGSFYERLLDHYRPRLETLYPEDWPARLQGLEEISRLAMSYGALDLFVADLALEAPEEDEAGEDDERRITLSTIHSAKGLEWEAVLILDLVEDRFPSRHAQSRPEDFEEERRLFYVACTRARKRLELYAPASIFSKAERCHTPAMPSPLLRELSSKNFKEDREKGVFGQGMRPLPKPESHEPPPFGAARAEGLGYCRHRIFGRGKIVRRIGEDKAQVNFPGFGLKVILSDYLLPED